LRLGFVLVVVAGSVAVMAFAGLASGARTKSAHHRVRSAGVLGRRLHRNPNVMICEGVRSLIVLPQPDCGGTATNLSAVVSYARKWAGSYICTTKTNCSSYTMSSVGYNPEFWDFSNDCTNFVSQAMWAGGWPTSSGWWYADDDPMGMRITL
jgi:hypothetical protein